MELAERVAICETEIENVKEKVDKQDRLIDSIYELASGQKELNLKMSDMEKDLSSVKKDVREIQLQPCQDYRKIGFEITKWVVIFILGYFVSMLIK